MAARMPIALLKTKSSPTDPYDEYFSTHPFSNSNGLPSHPIFVPVLKHQYVNLDRLEKLVMGGHTTTTTATATATATAGTTVTTATTARGEGAGEEEYAGLIITSQRAVEALRSVLEKLRAREETKAFLADTIVYVVGPATSAAVLALGFQDGNVRGEQCGSGIALAHFILADYDSGPRPAKRRALLFLNNERRGDDIPRILGPDATPDNCRVPLAELVVYETHVVAEFEDEFRRAMHATKGLTRWVVVFSPAGADVAWNLLREKEKEKNGRTYWATIGPTTERHLVETVGRRPDVVAKKPSPQGLWQGIDEFLKAVTAGEGTRVCKSE